MSRKQKKVNKPHHRRCSFEALEVRRLLAGDVKVTLVGGKATVKGDDLANAIVITSAGVRAVAGSQTTINGGAGPFAFTTAVNTLKVDMNGGADTLTLGDKPVPPGVALLVTGKAEIKLGSGDDTFLYQNTTVNQKLTIHKGSGRDTVRAGTGNSIGKLKPKVDATATVTGPPTINEGSSVTINLSATPKNKKDKVTQWSIDWGDGSAAQIVNGNPTTATHQYAVADDYVVTATATVAKKGNKKDTFLVDADYLLTVLNVAPTVSLNAPGSRSENGTVTLTGSFTDPGVTQGHLITVDWDDDNSTDDSIFEIDATNGAGLAGTTFTSTGSDTTTTLTVNTVNTTTGLVTFTVAHQYLDDGDAGVGNGTASDDSNIQVTVEDFVGPDPVDFTADSLSSTTSSTNVTINNVVPTVAVNPIATIVEAGTATVSGSFTDIGSLDDHTVTVNWGDGTQSVFAVPAITTPLTAGQTIASSSGVAATLTIGAGLSAATGFVPFSAQHVYGNNGVFTVLVTVADDDGGTNSGSNTLTVTNATPIVAVPAFAANPILEAGTATVTGSFTDVGVNDTHTVTVNWGDPNSPTTSIFSLGATNTLSNGQTFNSTTGDGAVLTLTAAPTAGGVVAYSVATHTYRDDGIAPGNGLNSDNSLVVVTVADPDSSGSNSNSLAVNNVAPSVVPADLSAAAINENDLATLNGKFTDVGLLDTHTITVNWGDSTPNSVFSLGATNTLANGQTFTSGDGATLTLTAAPTAAGVVSFSVKHRYLDDQPAGADTFTIGVTVADDDSGNSGNITTTVAVNNVAPTVLLNSVAAILEGGSPTLTGSFTDAGVADTHTVTVNWGDVNNATNSVFQVTATNTLSVGQTFTSTSGDAAVLRITSVSTATGQVSFIVESPNSHRYLDDDDNASTTPPDNNTASDTRTITVTVADDDGGTNNATTSVTINNVQPTVALGTVAAINENGAATLTGSFTDPGLLDVHTVTVNWNDPTNANNSVFTVTAIRNAAGAQTLTNGATFTSTGADTTTILTIVSVDANTGVVNFSVQHTYRDDGAAPNTTPFDSSLIQVTVADDDTGSGSGSTTVTVNNVAPVLSTLNSVALVEESIGIVDTLTGSFTDPGLADAHTLTISWGDLNNLSQSIFAIPATSTLTGPFPLAPITSTGADTTSTLVITGVAGNVVSFTVRHRYADDGQSNPNTGANALAADQSAVTGTIADDDTGSNSLGTVVNVNNANPTIDLTNPPAAGNPTAFVLNGSFADNGLNDFRTIVITWGDATTSTFQVRGTSTLAATNTFTQTAGSASTLTIVTPNQTTGVVTFTATHTYAAATNVAAGVKADITDDDGEVGTDTTTAFAIA